MKPVCLVIGAGAGIGGHVGKRFALAGHHAVLCRRSDEEGLRKLVASIEADGGSASGFLLDAAKEDSIEERVAAVEADIGPIEVVLFNLGAQIGNRSLGDTSYKAFELGWRLATFALFRLASSLFPKMVERVKRWLKEGREVKIMTARVAMPHGRTRAEAAIKAWCKEHIGQELPVTHQKDYGMIELWDDRAVQVRMNTGEPIDPTRRGK